MTQTLAKIVMEEDLEMLDDQDNCDDSTSSAVSPAKTLRLH